MMQQGEEIVTGKVTQCTIGPEERTIETHDNNPFLNSIIIEFSDGQLLEYSAKFIVENC
jgi:hypothetical protein